MNVSISNESISVGVTVGFVLSVIQELKLRMESQKVVLTEIKSNQKDDKPFPTLLSDEQIRSLSGALLTTSFITLVLIP